MNKYNFFDDLQAKVNYVLENSPAKDIKKNVKALFNTGFSKLDLVTREEFDVQMQILANTREKLDALALHITALETQKHTTADDKIAE